MTTLDTSQIAVVVLSGFACWHDTRTRRIPNAVTLGGAAIALAFAGVTEGAHGLTTGVLGWVTGLALFFPFFALGGMGAGDVKWLACVGAWLGPSAALVTALAASMVGGVMALAVASTTGYLGQAVGNTLTLVSFWRRSGLQPLPALTLGEARGPRLPYAWPIAVGAVVAMWWT